MADTNTQKLGPQTRENSLDLSRRIEVKPESSTLLNKLRTGFKTAMSNTVEFFSRDRVKEREDDERRRNGVTINGVTIPFGTKINILRSTTNPEKGISEGWIVVRLQEDGTILLAKQTKPGDSKMLFATKEKIIAGNPELFGKK